MTTLAYLRVSKDTQDTKNQRLAILEFAHAEGIAVDEFLELQASSPGLPRYGKWTCCWPAWPPGIHSW